jgi:hypothetical protein
MAMWLNCYHEDPAFEPSEYPHVPNVRTADGLKDIMAIGNILELATVLDRRNYSASTIHWTELLEMGSSRSMYRRLQSFIARKFVITVGEQPVLPMVVFGRSLVHFAAAVVVYKEDMESVGHKFAGCSGTKVKEKMVALFESNHPELLPRLLLLIESRAEYLDWTGPPISITKRTGQHRIFRRRKANNPGMMHNKPLRDFTDFPIYEAEENPQEESTSADGDDILEDAKMGSDAQNGSLGQGEQRSAPVEMDSPMEDGEGSEANVAEESGKPCAEESGAEDPGAMAVDGTVDGLENVRQADGNRTRSHRKPLSTVKEVEEEFSENLTAIAAEASSPGRQVLWNGGKAAEKLVESEKTAEDGSPLASKVLTRSRTGAGKPWSFGTSPAGKLSANRGGKGPAQSSQKEGRSKGKSPAKPSRKPMHVREGGSSKGENPQVPAQMPVAEEGPSEAVSGKGKGKRAAEQPAQPKKAAKRRRRRY